MILINSTLISYLHMGSLKILFFQTLSSNLQTLKLLVIFIANLRTVTSVNIRIRAMLITSKDQQFSVKHFNQKRFSLKKVIQILTWKNLTNLFGKRGHPEKVIREQGNRPLRSEDNAKKKDGRHKKGNGVPFVVTYYANFKNLSFLIHNNQ